MRKWISFPIALASGAMLSHDSAKQLFPSDEIAMVRLEVMHEGRPRHAKLHASHYLADRSSGQRLERMMLEVM